MSFVLSPRRQIMRSIYAIVGRASPEANDKRILENVTGNSRIDVARTAAEAAEDELDAENSGSSSETSDSGSDSDVFVDAPERAGSFRTEEPELSSMKRRGSPDAQDSVESHSKAKKVRTDPTNSPNKTDSAPKLGLSSPESSQPSGSGGNPPLSPTPRRTKSLGFPPGRLAVFEFDFTDLEPLGTTLDSQHVITASTDHNAVSLWIDSLRSELAEDSVLLTSFLLNEKPVLLVKSVEEILSLIRGQDLGAHSVVKVRRMAAESPLVHKVPLDSVLAQTVLKRKLLHVSNIQQYQLQCIELANVATFIETILRAEGVSILFT